MNNLEVIEAALLEKFSPSSVTRFLQWVEQDPDLMRLVDQTPQRAIIQLTEILRIATEA